MNKQIRFILCSLLLGPLSCITAQHTIQPVPDPNALNTDIHEVQRMKADYRLLRTNRHLRHFRSSEPIRLTIFFWTEGTPRPHTAANTRVLVDKLTPWAVTSILFYLRGRYDVTWRDATGCTALKMQFSYTDGVEVTPAGIAVHEITCKE